VTLRLGMSAQGLEEGVDGLVHRERLGELEGRLEIGLVVMEDPAQDMLRLWCRPIGEMAQGVGEGPAPGIGLGMHAEGRQMTTQETGEGRVKLIGGLSPVVDEPRRPQGRETLVDVGSGVRGLDGLRDLFEMIGVEVALVQAYRYQKGPQSFR
jgi:hypothetical protein